MTQASFLRRINRSGHRNPDEPPSDQLEGTVVEHTSADHLQHHDARLGRAGSEPTVQLSSSISPRSRSNQRSYQPPFKRNVSNADSHLPGEIEKSRALPEELDDSSDLADTRGLGIWYNPPKPLLNLVFIHGLGGSSLKTWSFERQTRNFWPLWLHRDPDLATARILTFGYNADFRGPSTILDITDFAKDLLFRMLTFEEEAEDGSKIRLDEVRHMVSNGVYLHRY